MTIYDSCIRRLVLGPMSHILRHNRLHAGLLEGAATAFERCGEVSEEKDFAALCSLAISSMSISMAVLSRLALAIISAFITGTSACLLSQIRLPDRLYTGYCPRTP